MIEIITQYPIWSSEQIERAVTFPIEIAFQRMPGLTDIRSRSIFGLSDVKAVRRQPHRAKPISMI